MGDDGGSPPYIPRYCIEANSEWSQLELITPMGDFPRKWLSTVNHWGKGTYPATTYPATLPTLLPCYPILLPYPATLPYPSYPPTFTTTYLGAEVGGRVMRRGRRVMRRVEG